MLQAHYQIELLHKTPATLNKSLSVVIVNSYQKNKLNDAHLKAIFGEDDLKQFKKVAELTDFSSKPKTHIHACTQKDKCVFILGENTKNEEYAEHLTTVFECIHKTYAAQDVELILDKINAKALHQIILTWHKVHYNVHHRFALKKEYKEKKDTKDKTPKLLITYIKSDNRIELEAQLRLSVATIEGMLLSQDLANLPPNIATPTFLADVAKKIAKNSNYIQVNVLDEKQIAALGMNSFLAVSQGSAQPPKLISLEYRAPDINGKNNGKAINKQNLDIKISAEVQNAKNIDIPKMASEKVNKKIRAMSLNDVLPASLAIQYKNRNPIVLVGKGITFDSGGISLKPGESMDEMKFDMCGAATVLGTFHALSILKPDTDVIGVVASCENMPDAKAVKPGDVIKTMNGLTVEILNTDAEGRLILCDALTYAQQLCEKFIKTTLILNKDKATAKTSNDNNYKAKAIIDLATLTGACVVALGHHNSGLFCNNTDLQSQLLESSQHTLDGIWPMPLDKAYNEQLKSNFADLANIGGRAGGSITAACFLQHFIEEDTAWAHLDIAGTAWQSGKNKGATGRSVGLLLDFLAKNHPKN
jgi:leucyl aminopeptidase